MKRLFIPLKTKPFEAFKAGTKTEEYRKYGPRWNEHTCPVGAQVTLSKGYGTEHRIEGAVTSFRRIHARSLSVTSQTAVLSIYNTLDIELACIGVRINEKPPLAHKA